MGSFTLGNPGRSRKVRGTRCCTANYSGSETCGRQQRKGLHSANIQGMREESVKYVYPGQGHECKEGAHEFKEQSTIQITHDRTHGCQGEERVSKKGEERKGREGSGVLQPYQYRETPHRWPP